MLLEANFFLCLYKVLSVPENFWTNWAISNKVTLVPKAQKYYIHVNFMGNGGSTEEKNPNQHHSGGKSGLFGSIVDLHGSPLVKTSVGSSVNW